jgi:hypothetical protein
MERAIPIRTGSKAGTAARFLAIGVVLYALLFAGAEWLVYRNGHMNPLFRIETARHADFDWVILGASHAMPLDFGGFNDVMETRTGLKIINLAGPGAGPLYNLFVLERFLDEHRARRILYVADAFAFRSPMWNEERFSDPKLLARTPLGVSTFASLARYVAGDGVDPRALLDYVTGFSKINNRDRFSVDAWEGEATFDRTFKPSVSAEKKRAEYLYPAVEDEAAARVRYLSHLASLIETAKRHGAKVTVAKLPLPARFKALLQGETEFDAALRQLASQQGAAFVDFSNAMDESRYYADTDHLNRTGATALFEHHLKQVLTSGED